MQQLQDKVWYPGKEQDDLKKSIENKIEALRTSIAPEPEKAYENAELNIGSPPPLEQMSFINKEEEEEAREFIETEFLCGHRPRISGFYMALMVYERSEIASTFVTASGEVKSLLFSNDVIKGDKWRNCVGRVVLQGNDCYIGDRFPFKENWFRTLIRPFFNAWMSPARQQPWCKVGDWVMFPRAEGTPVTFKGKPLVLIPDDRALMIVQNPTDITRD